MYSYLPAVWIRKYYFRILNPDLRIQIRKANLLRIWMEPDPTFTFVAMEKNLLSIVIKYGIIKISYFFPFNFVEFLINSKDLDPDTDPGGQFITDPPHLVSQPLIRPLPSYPLRGTSCRGWDASGCTWAWTRGLSLSHASREIIQRGISRILPSVLTPLPQTFGSVAYKKPSPNV